MKNQMDIKITESCSDFDIVKELVEKKGKRLSDIANEDCEKALAAIMEYKSENKLKQIEKIESIKDRIIEILMDEIDKAMRKKTPTFYCYRIADRILKICNKSIELDKK